MNQQILVSAVVIGGVSLWYYYVTRTKDTKTTVTGIVVGAYMFLGIMALLDAFVPGITPLTGALALLAMFVVLLNDLPTLLPTIGLGGPGPSGGGGSVTHL